MTRVSDIASRDVIRPFSRAYIRSRRARSSGWFDRLLGPYVAASRSRYAGDLFDIEASLGEVEDQVERVVVGEVDGSVVGVEEHDGGQPAQSLVPVDQRMVADERVQQRSGLAFD